MSKAAMNLQDSFLNQVRRENTEVKVLLVNGTGLRGIVKGFDNFTVILQSRNGQHLIYKHAIAQLMHQKHGGPRREGDETGAGDIVGAITEQDETEQSAAAEPAAVGAAPQPREHQNRGERQPRSEQPRGDRQPRPDQPRGERQPRPEQPRGGGDQQGQNQNRPPRKEGFNRLDLSSVRLSAEDEQKVESK